MKGIMVMAIKTYKFYNCYKMLKIISFLIELYLVSALQQECKVTIIILDNDWKKWTMVGCVIQICGAYHPICNQYHLCRESETSKSGLMHA